MEANPSPEIGGVAKYDPFQKGFVREIMCFREINLVWRKWGVWPPSSKCSVVDIANVPHYHSGRGASRWIEILGS